MFATNLKHLSWRFCKFALVGAGATAIHYAILALLVELFGIRAVIASTVGFIVSATSNYAINRRFTFESDAKHVVAAPKFIATALVGVAMNAVGIQWFVGWTSGNYLVAQIFATALVVAWNFTMNAFWTFKQSR